MTGKSIAKISWLALTAVFAGCDGSSAADHLARATEYQAQGRLSEAVIELKVALQKDPTSPEARFQLGDIQYVLNEYLSAIRELERALDLGVPESRVLPPLLLSKLKVGRVQEVLGELSDQEQPSALLTAIHGAAYLQSGEVSPAERLFNQALEKDESIALAQSGLGLIAWRNGQLDTAANRLSLATTVAPSDRESWLTKANFEIATGSPDRAIESYRVALGLLGKPSLVEMGLARAYLVNGDYDVAWEYASAALKREPDYPPARYVTALSAFMRGDKAAAEADLQRVLNAVPDHSPSLYLLGLIKYQQRQYGQAQHYLKRYLLQDRNNVSVRKVLAALQIENGAFNQALATLKPIEAFASSDAAIAALLGKAYLESGEFPAAIEYLGSASALAPDISDLRKQLAVTLLASGDSEGAQAELKSVVELNDGITQDDYLLAMLFLYNNDLQAARAQIEAMIQVKPNDPMNQGLLAAVHLGHGAESEAIEAFEAALVLDPEFVPAVASLVRLDIINGDAESARRRIITLLESDPDNLFGLVRLAELESGDRRTRLLERAVKAHPQQSRPKLLLAQAYSQAGDADGALRLTEESLALAPEDPHALLAHAELLVTAQRLSEAERYVIRLHELLDASHRDTATNVRLAELLYTIGRIGLCRQRVEAILASEADNPTALQLIVRLDLAGHHVDDAERHLNRLLATNPAGSNAMLEGEVALANNDIEKAIAALSRATASGDRNAVLRLANVYAGSARHAEAKASLQSWLSGHEKDQVVRFALASLYAELGETDEAIAALEQILEQAPGNQTVATALTSLYRQQGVRPGAGTDTRDEML